MIIAPPSLKSYGNVQSPATACRYTQGVNVLLIVCHPHEQSFSHAIGQRIEETSNAAGISIVRHNLYAEKFDPVLSDSELARQYSFEPIVQHYSEELRNANHFVFVHPDWWSGPPALLKGWIDLVFRPGVAYDWVGEEFTEKRHEPLLTGRTASVFVSTDRASEDPPEGLRLFWTDLCTYAGIALSEVRIFPGIRLSSIRQRRGWLNEVEASVIRLADQSPDDGTQGGDT